LKEKVEQSIVREFKLKTINKCLNTRLEKAKVQSATLQRHSIILDLLVREHPEFMHTFVQKYETADLDELQTQLKKDSALQQLLNDTSASLDGCKSKIEELKQNNRLM